MPTRATTAILFDAVGTLICPDPPVAAAYGAAGRRHGSNLTEAEIGQRFRQAFRGEEELDTRPDGSRTDEARESRRWRTIVDQVFDDVRDGEALFSELWAHFAQPRHWRLFDDVSQTWQALAGQGLKLGIASNFDSRLRQVCAGLVPLDRCDSIFVSSELGARKPSADFFSRIGQALEVAPERILLVGDDWSNDYLAARAAGWQALFLDRGGGGRADADSIRSLAELPARLGFKLV
jgi:putative hydrolase of the HAD superfamily